MEVAMYEDDEPIDSSLRIINSMLERTLEDCQYYSQKMFTYREIIIEMRKDWMRETGLSKDQWPYAAAIMDDEMFR
jgi:hypothetical protein